MENHESDAKQSLTDFTPQSEPRNAVELAISLLKQKSYGLTALAGMLGFFVLYSFLSGFWLIPGIDFGVVRNVPIKWFDVVYVVLISVFTGMLLALLKYKADEIKSDRKLAGLGAAATGFLAAVCPACQAASFAAFGATFFSIPLGPLIPYLWLLRTVSLAVLVLATILVLDNIFTKTCKPVKSVFGIKPASHPEKAAGKGPLFLFDNNLLLGLLVVFVALLAVNGFLIQTMSASSGGVITLGQGFEYGPKTTLKPMPLATGEQPRISGYKSAVKALPTISELPIKVSTGDVAQDLVNNIIPRGTPWYGQEAGVTFDDPITAQKLWAKARAIQLSGGEQSRWNRIVNSFTCDYCCGSPQRPTIITHCGCAHASAAQGMAKWFITNYGGQYSDEEIYGEMARWYALWYPGPTVKRIVQEMQTG